MADVVNQSSMTSYGSLLTLNGSTFQVGSQGNVSSLKSVAAGLPAGVSVSDTTIVVTRAGAVLEGYDFRGYSISVQADNVTIKNSLLNATGYHTVWQDSASSGMIVEFNTFDGQKANGTINSDLVLSENAA